MTRWLVIHRDYGQLGNRLHTHANALAWCIDNEVNLINLSFKNYSHWFSAWEGRSVETFISRKSKLVSLLRYEYARKLLDRVCRSDKWLKRLTKMMIREKKDSDHLSELELNQSFDSQKKAKALLVRAWDLRCPDALEKRQDTVREILVPAKEFVSVAKDKITKLHEKFDCIVGVHARRGDYKEYLGGIHFHSWDSYRNWIIQTKDLMEGQGKGRVGFLLCSDDNPPSSSFADLPLHFMGNKSVMPDLHALSLCDYNIGPPSSFGTWLSWCGKVPRLHLKEALKILSLDQFSVSSEC
jgi:hypothetical protein